ncbi:hypothetical protein GC163_04925 [bacterium]|nr:hypothetical protein [bacterium]
MHVRSALGLALWATWSCVAGLTPAVAQSVVLRLPADGTWVRYEGSFSQKEARPDSALGELEIPAWTEHVTLKSVGTTEAEYRGKMVPCRWLEIKVERGREADGKIAVGKTGLEIYKVLVPEVAVAEEPLVEPGIPVGYLPIIRGVRVLGSAEPQTLTEPALKLYPLALLFSYCRDMEVKEQNVDPGTGLGAVMTNLLAGTSSLERPNSQTQMTTEIWVSPDVPFGVAAWKAKIVRSVKDARQPRDAFQKLAEVDVELKAQGTGDNAQSEVNFE